MQAALLQSASHAATSDYQRGMYEGLRLAARGHAQRLDLEAEDTGALDERSSTLHRVLAVLSRTRSAQRPHQLARELGVSPAYLSRLLRAMTDDGLVSRSTAVIPTDKRAVTYALTVAGEDTLLAARRQQLATSSGPADDDVRRARLRAARTMLDGVQERRRKGKSGERDRDVLARVYKSALTDGDEILATDAAGEQVTASRQRRVAHATGTDSDLAVADATMSTIAQHAKSDSYARARHQYETGKEALEIVGQPELALTHFRETAHLLTAWPAAPIRVWNELAISECMRLTGDFYGAVECAHEAYEFARQREDSFATVKAGIQLGLAYRTCGMVDPCETLLTNISELAEAHAFPQLAAEARFHLGEASRYKGDTDVAIELLRAADSGLRTGKRGRGLAFAVSALGACYYDDADDHTNLAQSRDVLYTALEVCERASAMDACALTMRRLGHVLVTLGDVDQGGKMLHRALKTYQSDGTMSFVGQLECHTSLLAAEVSHAQMKRAVGALQQVKTHVSDHVEAYSGSEKARSYPQALLVDRWVIDSLRSNAHKLHDTASIEVLDGCWTELKDMGVVGSTRIHKGRSEMGKEPLLARRT